MKNSFISEIRKCLEENKDKIEIINSKKTEKSKKYNDEELFILWTVYSLEAGAPPFCKHIELTADEYIYCMYKIFGKESGDYTRNTIDRTVWNKKSSRRLTLEIIDTYNKRGVKFLNNIRLEDRTDLQIKYLNEDGKLNEKAKEIFIDLVKDEEIIKGDE